MNGLTQGFASFSRAFAPFIAGFLWSQFAEVDNHEEQKKWPLGASLTWNLFGILCFVSFSLSCWLRTPPKEKTDESADDVES